MTKLLSVLAVSMFVAAAPLAAQTSNDQMASHGAMKSDQMASGDHMKGGAMAHGTKAKHMKKGKMDHSGAMAH